MTQIISAVNEKGGVGKTTAVINLGAAIADTKKKVLLVDCDPQGSLTSALRLREEKNTLKELLDGKCKVNEAIYRWIPDNKWWIEKLKDLELYVLPSSHGLVDLEDRIKKKGQTDRYIQIRALMGDIKKLGYFDVAIIDPPPGERILSENGIAAGDHILITVEPEYLPMDATGRLLTWIFETERSAKLDINILGFIVVKYDQRLIDHAEAIEFLEKQKNYKVYKPFVKNLSVFKRANTEGIPAVLWRTTNEASKAYRLLAKEVMKDAGI